MSRKCNSSWFASFCLFGTNVHLFSYPSLRDGTENKVVAFLFSRIDAKKARIRSSGEGHHAQLESHSS